MGKKKSVVLMILLTIVIVALCVLTAFPVFTVPFTNGIKDWNPAVMQFDLGTDLGGGHYAYYYPNGVISETEYNTVLETLPEEDKAEHVADYQQHGGLYLSTDPEDGIIIDGEISADFKDAFKAAKDEICARYAAKGYSEYSVAVVDDYALRITLPASEVTETDGQSTTSLANASQALSLFALTGDMTFAMAEETVDQLKEEDVTVKDLVKSIKTKTQYEVAYVEIKFTDKGIEMLDDFTAAVGNSESGVSSLDIKIGGETMISITSDYIDNKVVKYSMAEEGDKRYVETVSILLNSILENGSYDVEFTVSEVRTFAPVYWGEKVLYFIFGALLAAIVGICAFSIVKMGRFGVVGAYTTLSYVIITALCFAFITKGVFAITPGSILIFLLGLVCINVFQFNVYGAIKKEFELGKTVESSVKGGYKKTFWGTVDVYAVLLLASLALLIAAASLQTLAIQALICVIAAAFCNILWARGINFVFLSASKNKYKYFRFVREDDDDE